MAKKRKIAGPAAVAKKRMKSGMGDRAPGKPQGAANVFETLWSRKKFDVLGKKQKKGETRRVGLSRSLAVDKRKKTLLEEYKKQGKANKFVDHRFGENDEDLPAEEKAIMRFQKERQAQINRKSKFTIGDEDEDEEETLTHGGMALSNVDSFNDNESLQDDDYLAELDEADVQDLHFGGGFSAKDGRMSGADEGQKPQKTKKEIMDEIIAKSKFYKAQKAKEKEEDQELLEKLDGDFSELVHSQTLSSLFRPTRKDSLKALLSKGSSKPGTSGEIKEGPSAEKDKADDFDKLMKEMVFDMRGRATDRLKTPEEAAKEERTRLEELEKKRKQRMLGELESDEDNEESDGEEAKEGKKEKRQRKKKRMEISGDDLGENFILDEEEEEGKGWVDEVLARRGEEEGGSGESEDGASESDEEEESDVDGDEDDGLDYDVDVESDPEELAPRSRIKQQTSIKKEMMTSLDKKVQKSDLVGDPGPGVIRELDGLPFVIDAPQTLGDFRALVDHRSNEDLTTAIQRIRTCNAISLAAENRRKMQVFYNVLLQYFGSLALETPFSLRRVNLVIKPLVELSSETPYFAAVCARQRLVHMHKQLTEKLKKSDGSSCWPTLRTLLLLRFWSMVFPPSDLRHPVMTPAILFMAEFLTRCPITSGRDIAVGTFVCSLLLSVLREARRFCPEVINFLTALLVSALPSQASGNSTFAKTICPAFMVELVLLKPLLVLKGKRPVSMESLDLDFVSLMTSEESITLYESDVFRVSILRSVLQTLQGFVSLYEDLTSFSEVFSPVLLVLKRVEKELVLPEQLQQLRSKIIQSIEVKSTENEQMRQPLRMRIQKRVPIKQFNPKFEENYVQGRNYDPDRERAEKKKLVRQVKQEAKGAARELRKDNYFLSEEKAKEKRIAEEERKEKYGKAMAFLQEQESAFKSGQLGGGKKRRRK